MHVSATVKVEVASSAMVSGGSLSSRSLTRDGDTMIVHESPDWRSSAGSTV